MYASKLTKEDLIRDGINDITPDGRVIRNGYEIKLTKAKSGYFAFSIYQYDSEGNKEKKPITRVFKYATTNGIKESKPIETYVYKTRSIGLHRAMWAWFHGEVPEGMVVDHRNNKHDKLENYRLENLQLLTQKENVAKERPKSIKELPCKLSRPRSYYENKLKTYEELYEAAKKAKDADKVHKLRTNISQTRARLRYYDNHREEFECIMAVKKLYTEEELAKLRAKKKSIKERKELTEWKNIFKSKDNKPMWHQLCTIIKNWDTYEDFQKEHVFDVLYKTYGNL